jgi:hypothetical protein
MDIGHYGAESFGPQLQQGKSNTIMVKSVVTIKGLPQGPVIWGDTTEASAPQGCFTEVVFKGHRAFW